MKNNIMSLLRLLAFLVLAAFGAATARAEIVHGIEPFDSLGDIKEKYPGATVEPVVAAWVKRTDGFFKVSGNGIPGYLMIAFNDLRYWPFESEITPTLSDDLAYLVRWVRWVPEASIPLARYVSKYGKPTRCGFSDDSMAPYCEWRNRGLTATLSDDKKMVEFIDAQFTEAEKRAALNLTKN